MDGHTPEGAYKVTLVLTKDMVDQFARLINLAKLMGGRDFTTGRHNSFDIIAYRAFLEEILVIIYEATKDAPVTKEKS